MYEAILVCEDESITRFYLNTILSSINGFSVHVARDGTEGLKIFNKEKIDLILTDILMQPMDGIEFIKRIRSKDKTVPIITFSAYRYDELKDLDVQGFMNKPVDLTILTDMLSNYFKKKED